jgi:serpin B
MNRKLSALTACLGLTISCLAAGSCKSSEAPRNDAAAGGMGSAQRPDAGPTEEGAAGTAGQRDSTASMPAAGEPSSESAFELVRARASSQAAPHISDADYTSFIASMNKFGIALQRAALADEKLGAKNFVYSPLSTTLALAQVYGGARGETEQEMKLVLRDGFSDRATFHEGCNRVTRELASRVNLPTDPKSLRYTVDLALANSMFAAKILPLEDEFLQLLAEQYDTGVRKVDFSDPEPVRMAINRWVSQQTRDTVNELIPMGAIDESTQYVLVNSLYFNAWWLDPFSLGATADEAFHRLGGDSVTVPTMHAQRTVAHAENDDFAAIELPFAGRQLRFTIVLPREGKFESVRAQLGIERLDQLQGELSEKFIKLNVPKAKFVAGTYDFRESLETLGMKAAFTDRADFTGLAANSPSLAKVLHKAFIEIDEQGTEASAATAVIAAGGSAPAVPMISFIADRPFLFFVRDASGAIVFSGHILDPSAQE